MTKRGFIDRIARIAKGKFFLEKKKSTSGDRNQGRHIEICREAFLHKILCP